MSIVTSYFLLLLLCLSLHGSHARRLGAIDKELERNSHFSNQNDGKENVDLISVSAKVKSSLSEELKDTKTGCIGVTDKECNNAQKPKETIKAKQMPLTKGANKNISPSGVDKSSVVESSSLVSVSWRVPHKKSSERHPGFNLDYSPPKTHPPSHN